MDKLIQVAGVVDAEEARMLADAGVHQIGFPLRLAVHGEDISEEEAATIIASLEPSVSAVLITYLARAEEILDLRRKLRVPIVQLHSDLPVKEVMRLKSMEPRLYIIKSLIVRENNLAELEAVLHSFEHYVDAFITDTYDPETLACGATGKIHDWAISRRLVELSKRPVILAGGLNPANVKEAILSVGPAGVDAHTGLEGADGRKERSLVEAFVREAAEGFRLRSHHESPY